MLENFKEFANQKVEEQKHLLDQKTHTGTIQNYSERFNLFSEGIKILNGTLVEEANRHLKQQEKEQVNNSNLKNDLLAIAKESINNYIKYFKGE